MKKPLFTGTCTALVTPFLDGRINYPMAEMLLRRQIDAGISAVVLAGTTGEAPTLSDNEKLELVSRCKAYAKDECLIIAGTGSMGLALAEPYHHGGSNRYLTVGGWANPTSDPGSGFDIATQGIQAAFHAFDGIAGRRCSIQCFLCIGARFDLNKGNSSKVGGNDVNFHMSRAPITLLYSISMQTQIAHSNSLAKISGLFGCFTCLHLCLKSE